MKRFLPFLLLLLLPGCQSSTSETLQFFAMDALMSATAHGKEATQALTAVQEEVNRLDALWSRTKSTSDVAMLNTQSGTGTPVTLDPDTIALLTLANQVALESDGAFNPLLAPVIDLWDFTGEHPQVPDADQLAQALAFSTPLPQVGDTTATLAVSGQAIDLGGIAKGATASAMDQVLSQYDLDGALVSLGTSSVYATGTNSDGDPWRIGVTDPDGSGTSLGIFTLTDGQICATSGAYQRYFQEDGTLYHHIIDPATGFPSESDLTSVTVISNQGAWTDAWSTALFVMGLEDTLAY